MYYISDYKKQAVQKIIPYLIDFPQIISIIEDSANRYQAIENVIWNVADNFSLDNARGVFLQALANNEVTEIIYTDKANDAFIYGTDEPLFQAYGVGYYYSQASYISGVKKSVTDEKTIRAVKAKIIQNNTNCTIKDLIECLKLYYNADGIKVYESYPLNVSIMLCGKSLEVSSSNNRKIIKNVLPACVSLNNIYLDYKNFNLFRFDQESSYGDCRYPIIIHDTTDVYQYHSQAVTLNSVSNEYIKTNNILDINKYVCFIGRFTDLITGATLINSTEEDTYISLTLDENNQIVLDYNGVIYDTNIIAEVDKNYYFILSNINNKLKLWINNTIDLYGLDLTQDVNSILNKIRNVTPVIEIEDYTTIEQPLYINSKNGISNFGDFTYYAIVFGDITNQNIEPEQYYISSFGNKQILFNCFSNDNHLQINTTDSLSKDIMTIQPYFNYQNTHLNSKYLYLDGKSGIDYTLSDTSEECDINSLDIKFDVCMPTELNFGNILTDFVDNKDGEAKIYFDSDKRLNIEIPTTITTISTNEDNEEKIETNEIISKIAVNEAIDVNEYAKFKISYNGTSNKIFVYKNEVLIHEEVLNSATIKNLPTILKVGYDKDIVNPFKGFVKNISLNIIGIDTNDEEKSLKIDLPFDYTLNNTFEHTNYGARFITTPQLFTDSKNVDLYNNKLLNNR